MLEPKAEAVVHKYKRGAWSKEEDAKLISAVEEHGIQNWTIIEKSSGLARPAKNCRLRWFNYLRPDLKKYPFTQEEKTHILLLHSKYGNCWSQIASMLPGRSENDIKNFWYKRAKKNNHTSKHIPDNFGENDERTTLSSANITTYEQHMSLSQQLTPTDNALLDTPTSRFSSTYLTDHTSNSFIPIRATPILSSPHGCRFSRLSRKTSQMSDSSLQWKYPSSMESPRNSKLENSVYSIKKMTDSPVSVLQHNSLTPSPSSCSSFQFNSLSSLQVNSPIVQLNSPSVAALSFDSDYNVAPEESSFSFKTKCPPNTGGREMDQNLEIVEALREAEERVRFLKKKLKLSNKLNSRKKGHKGKIQLDRDSHQMSKNDESSSRKLDGKIKDEQTFRELSDGNFSLINGFLECKSNPRLFLETKCLEREENLPGERQSMDLLDQTRVDTLSHEDFWEGILSQTEVSGECLNKSNLSNESSSFLHDGLFMEDLFAQPSGIEYQLSSHGLMPNVNALDPNCRHHNRNAT